MCAAHASEIAAATHASSMRAGSVLTRACVRMCVLQNGEKVHSIQGCNIPAIHTYIKENAPKNDA